MMNVYCMQGSSEAQELQTLVSGGSISDGALQLPCKPHQTLEKARMKAKQIYEGQYKVLCDQHMHVLLRYTLCILVVEGLLRSNSCMTVSTYLHGKAAKSQRVAVSLFVVTCCLLECMIAYRICILAGTHRALGFQRDLKRIWPVPL